MSSSRSFPAGLRGVPVVFLLALTAMLLLPALGLAQGIGFTGVAPPGFFPLPGGPGSQPAVESIRKRFLPQPDAPPPGIPGQPPVIRPTPPPLGTGENILIQARLGTTVERPCPALRTQLDLPRGQGLVLGEVRKGTSADRAGLRTHDILLEIDGHSVPSDPQALTQLLLGIKGDQAVDVVVVRSARSETIKEVRFPLVGNPKLDAKRP
jgi:PDZ domain